MVCFNEVFLVNVISNYYFIFGMYDNLLKVLFFYLWIKIELKVVNK